MYYIYVIQSETTGKLFKGQTQNIKRTLDMHNAGEVYSTEPGRPWKLIHEEAYASRMEATIREREIKSIEGSKALKRQLGVENTPGAQTEPGA